MFEENKIHEISHFMMFCIIDNLLNFKTMKVFFGSIVWPLLLILIIACNDRKSLNVSLLTNRGITHDSLQVVRQLNLSKKNLLINYSLSISQAI